MLILSESIAGKKIMSLHAGGAIASLGEPIIDPSKLKIEGFSVNARGLKFYSVLHSGDIREWSALGAIVNSEDSIIEVDENMPKIKQLVEDGYQLLGTGVRTESGKRLGKVKNFVFETDGFNIVKLYIEKMTLMGIVKAPISIERDSIVNVTKKFLVVSDNANKISTARDKVVEQNVEYGFGG